MSNCKFSEYNCCVCREREARGRECAGVWEAYLDTFWTEHWKVCRNYLSKVGKEESRAFQARGNACAGPSGQEELTLFKKWKKGCGAKSITQTGNDPHSQSLVPCQRFFFSPLLFSAKKEEPLTDFKHSISNWKILVSCSTILQLKQLRLLNGEMLFPNLQWNLVWKVEIFSLKSSETF